MLIIFDCDGVLVDSERLSAEIFSETLLASGIEFSAEQCFKQFTGWRLDACYHWLEASFKCKLPEAFSQQLNDNTIAQFNQRLKPIAGVDKVLAFLARRSASFCVASNGPHEKINASLDKTGLSCHFPASQRFSASDVDQGKPSPSLFLKAAEFMGVPPRFCWVVEDTTSGCEAAIAAGMNLIYFNGGGYSGVSVEYLNPAFVCENMATLLAFFKNGCEVDSGHHQ